MSGAETRAGGEHVDTVVVGSGFGGSVVAYRLAEAGRPVVLLERGRAYPPGSFPRSPREMGRALWDPSEGLFGLFDVWRFGGFDSPVASGLGGGSLISANVLLRKDERSFVRERPLPGGGYEHWPLTRADLDPHYDAVERMLGARPYPLHAAAFSDTSKTHALIEFAERSGLEWELPPLGVSFAGRPWESPALGVPIAAPPYGNIHGAARRTCRLSGECALGCNDGAKNSLDHTYLSAAQYSGADIRTGCQVRGIRPMDGGGYAVTYAHRDVDTGETGDVSLTCDRLVLAAGTYGTTYLLLRNRDALPGLGPALGTRFSRSGDVLTFLLPGRSPAAREFDGSHGPVTTAALRFKEGFSIQDGGYPAFAYWLSESKDLTARAFRLGEFVTRWVLDAVRGTASSGLAKEVSRLLAGGVLSAGSLPLIGVGRDVPDGVLSLRDGLLAADLNPRTSDEYTAAVRAAMREIAETFDAEFVDNASWFFRRVLTVHPVGGAPMGRDAREGVCDGHGQVFGHPGLYVADGAAMPGPVGPNPALTIAAYADRLAARILAEPVRGRPCAGVARPLDRVNAPGRGRFVAHHGPARGSAPTWLSFTEEMAGFVAFGETDPVEGDRLGRALDQRIGLRLTITADDVEAFVSEPGHVAKVQGWITAEALGGRRLVTAGAFELFVDGQTPRRRQMRYRLSFLDGQGTPLALVGHKTVRDDGDTWAETSTLYAQVLGAGEDPRALGAGVLRTAEADFIRQLSTFRAHGPRPAAAIATFARLYLGPLWDGYGMHVPIRGTSTTPQRAQPASRGV